ncbi:MAG: hypothetical protein FJY76_03955 [Candidatus Aenigmarchaeota archaeon]|nr:hypothetical protein [Candidatus Aenigmarchaeota archaeon]
MKAVLWTVFVLFALFAAVFLIVQGYRMDRDIDSLIDRAQVAADRDDMLKYVNQLKTNMEHWGMTEGHTALIFKNPRNDMALHYEAVKKIIERLEAIKELPKNETGYQVALNDLRGTIRELPNPAKGWLWVCYGWWFLLIGIVLLIAAVVAIREYLFD